MCRRILARPPIKDKGKLWRKLRDNLCFHCLCYQPSVLCKSIERYGLKSDRNSFDTWYSTPWKMLRPHWLPSNHPRSQTGFTPLEYRKHSGLFEWWISGWNLKRRAFLHNLGAHFNVTDKIGVAWCVRRILCFLIIATLVSWCSHKGISNDPSLRSSKSNGGQGLSCYYWWRAMHRMAKYKKLLFTWTNQLW